MLASKVGQTLCTNFIASWQVNARISAQASQDLHRFLHSNTNFCTSSQVSAQSWPATGFVQISAKTHKLVQRAQILSMQKGNINILDTRATPSQQFFSVAVDC
jgi:hypothetical protein